MVERKSDGNNVFTDGSFNRKGAGTQGLQFPAFSTPELDLIQIASLHRGQNFLGRNLERLNAAGLKTQVPSVKDLLCGKQSDRIRMNLASPPSRQLGYATTAVGSVD